jgi:uncharacterized membrane protein
MTTDPAAGELAIQFDPVGSWAFVAIVAAALAAVLVFLGPDRSRLTPARFATLMALRIAAFLLLVACMIRPTLVSSSKARRTGTVIVLADASESMTVPDGRGGRSRWDEMQESLAAAAPAVRRMAAEGGFEFLLFEYDRVTHPVATKPDDPLPGRRWERRDSSGETAIGSAIDDGLRAAAGRNVVGLVVLGDGAQHAYPPRDLPPQTAARKVREIAAPIWTVTYGERRAAGQARDAAVASLTASDTVFLGNTIEVAGRVRLDGLADRDATVRLLAEDGSGKLVEAARTTVRGSSAGGEQAVRLSWTPDRVGERKIAIVIDPIDGETVATNNELSTFVEVVEGGLRLLYVEGAVRVEQRFLRRVLSASPDIQVDYQWVNSSRPERWPVDLSDRLAERYDVFLVGDVDSAALRPQDLETIRGRVEAGAGIGFLGGFHAFDAGGWGFTPLAPLVPWKPDRLARQERDGEIRRSLHIEGPLRMVPDPRFGAVSIFNLGEGLAGEQLRAKWRELPPLDGANAFGQLLPQAKPLAVTENGRPLLVARDYGIGRVAAFAADSTWRWAMKGAAREHRRFWRQLVLWLARRDGADADSLWLKLSQRRLSPGTTLSFDAGVMRPDGTAATDVTLDAVAISPSGVERPVRVDHRGEGFSGTIGGCAEPGDWTVELRRAGGPPATARRARFTVVRQDLELASPIANQAIMAQVASPPGGTRSPEEVPRIFEEIAATPAAYETTTQWSMTPWDSWPLFLLLAGLLCVEWGLRKRFGLV